MNRAEYAGRQLVEAAILVALEVSSFYPDEESGNIAEVVMEAIDEGCDYEDHEALAATAMAKLAGHDPETRA